MLPSHFINTCRFTPDAASFLNIHLLSLPRSLCLSAILSSWSLFRFDIKLTGSCIKIIN
jgi:hypothetical protein